MHTSRAIYVCPKINYSVPQSKHEVNDIAVRFFNLLQESGYSGSSFYNL